MSRAQVQRNPIANLFQDAVLSAIGLPQTCLLYREGPFRACAAEYLRMKL